MNKSQLKITKVDATRVGKARKAVSDLYQLTKKYASTTLLKTNVESRLDVLFAFYAANVGRVIYRGMRFPYNAKDWRITESDAKQIYNFAQGKGKASKLWEEINKVFDRVRALAEWLEEGGGRKK